MGAIEGADAVVLVTEWPEFAELDSRAVAAAMKGDVLVDGRNLFLRRPCATPGSSTRASGAPPSSPTAQRMPIEDVFDLGEHLRDGLWRVSSASLRICAA